MFKIRRSRDRLIFNMGITIPGKTVFILRRGFVTTVDINHKYNSSYNRECWLAAIAAIITSVHIIIFKSPQHHWRCTRSSYDLQCRDRIGYQFGNAYDSHQSPLLVRVSNSYYFNCFWVIFATETNSGLGVGLYICISRLRGIRLIFMMVS